MLQTTARAAAQQYEMKARARVGWVDQAVSSMLRKAAPGRSLVRSPPPLPLAAATRSRIAPSEAAVALLCARLY